LAEKIAFSVHIETKRDYLLRGIQRLIKGYLDIQASRLWWKELSVDAGQGANGLEPLKLEVVVRIGPESKTRTPVRIWQIA
jgi:hypothetical protein